MCRSNDTIECVNCHARILAQLPSVLQTAQCNNQFIGNISPFFRYLDRDCVEKISRSLVDSHHRYCVWKFMIIPESSVQLTDIYSKDTVNRYLHEGEEFLSRIEQIDIIGPLKTVQSIDQSIEHFFFLIDLSNRSN